MDMQAAIKAVTEKRDLTAADMEAVMNTIMTGEATQAQIGGFLIGLRMKSETVEEITAAAKVMRSLATRLDISHKNLIDTCGTGGDSSGIFNVSTASAFVAAAAGCKVAKHGNRSVSSKSGSADLLESAGVNLNLSAAQVKQCIDEIGIGFMFAPNHHSAMKHAIGPRREMGVRTIFNILGPLTNPASAQNQVLGVFSPQIQRHIAETLKNLGSNHVLVVNSDDGLDEISIAKPTNIVELYEGQISEYRIKPEDFGLTAGNLKELKVDNAEQSLQLIKEAFSGKKGAASDIIALNAGAAIYAADIAASLSQGIELAQDAMLDGSAQIKLEELIKLTNEIT